MSERCRSTRWPAGLAPAASRCESRGTRLAAAAAAFALWAASPAPCASAGPTPGTMLGPDTAAQAEGVLPPEFLGRYQRGEWRHEVVVPKPGTHLIDPEWIAAGKENQGKFTVNERGSIREISTGKQPPRI